MSKVIAPNFTQVPNVVVDELAAKLSDSAFKMYVVLIRKTKGWDQSRDAISISQFEKITGKSRPTVVKAIEELVKLRLIKKTKCTKFGNEYELNLAFSIDGLLLNFPSKKSLLVKNFNQASKKSLLLLVKNFNTQKKLSKETIKRTSGAVKKDSKKFSEDFEKFWSAYPTCKRKSDKSGTYKTFTKHEGCFAIETLLSILEKQKSDVSWTKQNGEFIPSPSVWLNQKQWENEFWFQVNSPVVAPDFSNAQLQYGDW
ncbi:bacteriophage replication O family protein [Acinetobacter sp. 1130196]|uniref:replication protein n=1 Tax=Acinetobacter calcoaceticus/baumannii complex TaxID=909768 RepID=UPI00044CD3A1|nr:MULTISPECIES: replication protein [Acinetobacter calcoaceticus/baumannii complex]AXX46584.1 hypothetical protein Aba10324_17520 [Acinetobacter baumannii]EXR08777.1 bacteriophage replication O family protein [Acinetobacter sp. 1130196]HEM7101675.1 replication protein [Acinetobacter baumannii]